MKFSSTWQAQIFCGLREEYSSNVFPIEKIESICQDYVDKIGWCVAVTPTKFIYKNGNEPGAIIGAIQYPRFPLEEKQLQDRVVELAQDLLSELSQFRLTIIFPDKTVLYEREDLEEKD